MARVSVPASLDPTTPPRLDPPTPHRLLGLVTATALLVVACSSGVGGPAAEGAPPDQPVASEPGGASSPAEADPTAPPAPAAELFSPTETSDPFDGTGGVASSSEGVTVVTDDPRSTLRPRVAQATEPWVTDWTRQTIDLGDLLLGIPRIDPRDAIPPIDTPRFEPIDAATWLGDREPGALVRLGDDVRFYPLSILTRHEIVNDRFGDVPVAVTFCPLCNTAITFDRRVDGRVLRLGVSGLLRNSDMVIWDDATNSLWQQISGEAIVGALAGTRLDIVSTAIVSYSDARADFPDAVSLARDTGFAVDYGANGYVGYSSSATPFLFDGEPDPRYPALSRVVGVSVDGGDKAYPFSSLQETGTVNDEIDGTPITVFWGGDTADALDAARIAEGAAIGTGIAFDPRVDGDVLSFSPSGDGRFVDAQTGTTWTLLGVAVDGPLTGTTLATVTHRNEFWFAWASFFPEADVYGS